MNQPLTKHLDGTLCISLFPITRDTWRTKKRDKEIWEALRAGYHQQKSTEITNNTRTKDKHTNRLPMQAFCSPKKSRFLLSFILFHVHRVEREELGIREVTQGQRNALLGNSPTTFTSPLSLTSLTRPDGNSAWVLRMSGRSKWTKTLSRSRWVGACNSTTFLSRRFQTDLFFDRISLEWDPRGSAMTNHKKPIDATASPDRSGLSFTKERAYKK